MKFQRPGSTETNLMFCDYLKQRSISDDRVIATERTFINWLVNCAGWYDKTIVGSSDYDYPYEQIINGDVYKEWLRLYVLANQNCDVFAPLLNSAPDHYFGERYQHFDDFIVSFGSRNHEHPEIDYQYWCKPSCLDPLLDKKNVLVLNWFSELAKQQYLSGNLHRARPGFPEIEIVTYRHPHFIALNQGMHANILETVEFVWDDIKKLEFDVAIIGFGAMGAILADRIDRILGRDAITMGSGVPLMFAIDPFRPPEPHWMTEIPVEYRPDNYQRIEGGRAWGGKFPTMP